MFDNLRDPTSSFYEDEQNDLYKDQAVKPASQGQQKKNTRFLGMTAQQRFFLSVMLMLMVCVVGVLAMFVLGKMSVF